MGDRHLVVVFQQAVAESRKNLPHPDHAEEMQFGGAQGPHAGGPEHMRSARHGPQDFLVPDGRNPLEVPVDDTDGPRSCLDCAGHVAL